MRKILLCLLVVLILLPSISQAKSFKDVRILLSYDIVKDCGYIGDSVRGCYYSAYKGQKATIYLSALLDMRKFRSALVHEIGHYLMDGTTEAEYNRVFGGAFGYYVPLKDIQEYGANAFVIWWFSNKGTPEQDKFFINLFR